MSDLQLLKFDINPLRLKQRLKIRKANVKDVEEIYDVACSVGTSEKDSEQGFLVDDYLSRPEYYKHIIEKKIESLDNFYVAEYDRIYGFLMAYEKENWLRENPKWIEEIFWKPDFNYNDLKKFIIVDKTAIYSNYTGVGIGSLLYEHMLERIAAKGYKNILSETIISPEPNFASLQFRRKQHYNLAGVRYENYNNKIYTDLVYIKKI